MRGMRLEPMERRYGGTSTMVCTQYRQKSWHQRLGSDVPAEAIMDRIIHNTSWIDTGNYSTRERAALANAQ